jgi:hypothetical protein
MTNRSTSNWPSRLEWMLIVGAWTTVALLTAVNRVLAPRGGGAVEWSQFPAALGRDMFEYGFWIVLTPLVFWLARQIPLESLEWPRIPRNVAVHLSIAVVAAFTVDASDILLRRALFPVPERFADFNVLHIITRLWFINELIVDLHATTTCRRSNVKKKPNGSRNAPTRSSSSSPRRGSRRCACSSIRTFSSTRCTPSARSWGATRTACGAWWRA